MEKNAFELKENKTNPKKGLCSILFAKVEQTLN